MTETSMVEKCLDELKKHRHIEGRGLIGADGRPYAVTNEDMRAWIRTIIEAMREPTNDMKLAGMLPLIDFDGQAPRTSTYHETAGKSWQSMISEALKG